MRIFRLGRFIPLIAVAVLTAGFGAEPPHSLVQKRTVGEEEVFALRYQSKSSLMGMTISGDHVQRVTKVEDDGGFTLQITARNLKAEVDGQEMPPYDPSELDEPEFWKYDAQGNFVDEEQEDSGASWDLALRFGPEHPVRVGESWTPPGKVGGVEGLTWTLVGPEELDGTSALRLDGKGKGQHGGAIESKVWLDPGTFALRKAEWSERELEIEGETGEHTASLVRKP